MAGANSNIQLSGLDFNDIKRNLKTFLQSQDTFKDYNFEGSALTTLLDILAYNTQYNAFYLNMVANEMFLDTALQRSSVVSHAKLLNYTPQSASAPTANVDISVVNVANTSLTLPAYTNFISESVDGVNYNFITTDAITATTDIANSSVYFQNVELRQGIFTTYSYTVDLTTNPSLTFSIPDDGVDTSTIKVTVQKSSTNSYFDIYTFADDYLSLNNESQVYFLQESLNGNYEIYFGDGVIGNLLDNGNIVTISYLITQGTVSQGANNFALIDGVTGFNDVTVYGKIAASSGKEKESIESIKFQAPKSYSAQKRAVTKQDYITLLQQNKLGYTFDAVNVWGGEESTPPVYGKVFVAIKPSGGYTLTQSQKDKIINSVLKPVSVMTVTPEIVDVDYVYLILESNVLYDSKKTNLTSTQIADIVKQGTIAYCNDNLNTFDSIFIVGDLINYVKNLNKCIIAVDYDVYLQKRLIPLLNISEDYTLNFGAALEKSTVGSESIKFYPTISQYDTEGNFYSDVYFEESPDSTTNIDSVSVINGGSNYSSNTTVVILGDGTGAKAIPTIKNGAISSITVTSGGTNYTQAIAQIIDTQGSGAVVSVSLRDNEGDLRSYYYVDGVKNILKGATHTTRAGYVDYSGGIVVLSDFTPTAINNTDGIYRVNGYAESRIISSAYDRIVTLDANDPESINVTVTAR